MKRPLVFIAVAFALGDVLGGKISNQPEIALIALASLLLFACLRYRHFGVGATLLILLLFLLSGCLWNNLARQKAMVEGQAWPRGTVVFTGMVAEDPGSYPDRTIYILSKLKLKGVSGSPIVKGRLQLVIYKSEPRTQYHYGDLLQVRGKIELPSLGRNPGEFNYREYLMRRGIYGRVSVFRPADVTRAAGETGNYIIGLALAAKGRVASLVDSVLPSQQAGVLLALLFGDQERLDDEQVDLYRTLGVMHIFSVSGLHVGFVLLFLLALGRLMRLPLPLETIIAVSVLVFYTVMVGFPPSVVRATVMVIIGLGARLVMREPDFYTSLAGAALIILIWNPLQIYDPGFQLSFVATWGLVYLEPMIKQWLFFLPNWRKYLVAPIAAQLGVLPLTALYFNAISLLAIPANILVVGLVGLITVLGLSVFVTALTIVPIGEIIALAVGVLILLMEKMLSLIGQIPGSAVNVSSPTWLTIGFYYLLMVAAREYWLHRSEPRWVAFLSRWKREMILMLISMVLVLFLINGDTGQLRVVFLDVGEGDAIFIQAPGNFTALIDGGGKAGAGGDMGERVVLPFLRREGIRKLDLVVSSHPDTDHLLGLYSVVKEIPVDRVIMAPVPEPPGDYRDFTVLLESRKVNYSVASRGMVVKLGPVVRLDVLNPSHLVRAESGDNNNSVVMKLVYGGIGVLLTGDIEHEAMQELATLAGSLRSTVIKMPHHGSKSGLEPEFFLKSAPEAVVISVGRNSFGHPSPEILNYWEEAGVPLYRTDLLGSVTFTSDGQTWSINGLLKEDLPKQDAGISGIGVAYAW